jgi:3-hydroxymyristoyl/3-hydroxydecanoyl-(acyl carrier protein) dehydratase
MMRPMTASNCPHRFRIGADHPALPGHFPDRPVVPGVVLLDRVAAAIEHVHGVRIAGFAQVKFLAPLLPEQDAEVHLDAEGTFIHFRILHNAATLASGIAEIEAADGAAR